MAVQGRKRLAGAGRRSSRRRTVAPVWEPAEIDTTVPHASRIYDYLLGGTTNFGVDREMAETVFGSAYAGGSAEARSDVRANRAFLGRAVRYVSEAGIRQFLDIGTGIPTEENVHEVAQRLAPESRVVYVDYDLIVQAHAAHLLDSTREGATAYLTSDLREPEKILHQAAATLDFGQPIALMLVAILHVIPDEDDAYGIVRRLLDALAPGSYLVLSHLASDINAEEMAEAMRQLNQSTHETFFLRDRSEVARFFDGLEMAQSDVVPVDLWRPTEPLAPGQRITPIYGAVARKV